MIKEKGVIGSPFGFMSNVVDLEQKEEDLHLPSS